MKFLSNSLLVLLVFTLVIFTACGPQEEDPANQQTTEVVEEELHQPITLQLIALVDNNPEIGEMLEASIAKAKEVNPDTIMNPVQNLDDYYSYIDRVSRSLPQNMLECSTELSMREQMLQGICYFYFLVSQPLDDLEGMGHFSNSLQYYEPFASWLRDFAVVQGQYMDTEDSWNQETFEEIFADTDFGLQEDWYEDSPTGTPSTDSFAGTSPLQM